MPRKQQQKEQDEQLSMDHEVLLLVLLSVLSAGVVVCDSEARIIFCNRAAADLFGDNSAPRTGDSLFRFCMQLPVKHALSILKLQQQNRKGSQGHNPYIQFLNASSTRDRFFRCRLAMLPPGPWKKKSFIMLINDVSTWYNPGDPLYMKVENFRAPMTNMRAAIENLTEYPEMSPVMRTAFENVLVQESINLSEAFDSLAQACNLLLQTQSPLAEMSTELLFGYVKQYLGRRKIPVAMDAEHTAQVKVDSFGLVLVLEFLAREILRQRKLKNISCVCHVGENFVYFDLIWTGKFLMPAMVKSLLEKRPQSSIGDLTVASILHSMEGDMWSQQLANKEGILRVALPLANKDELSQLV